MLERDTEVNPMTGETEYRRMHSSISLDSEHFLFVICMVRRRTRSGRIITTTRIDEGRIKASATHYRITTDSTVHFESWNPGGHKGVADESKQLESEAE